MRHLVGNGRNTSSWLDNWLDENPLITQIRHEISLVDMYKPVSEYWTRAGTWKWNEVSELLPTRTRDKLGASILREDNE